MTTADQHGLKQRRCAEVEQLLLDLPSMEGAARHVVERMALAFQASLLICFAPAEVAETFCATRLSQGRSAHFGGMRSLPYARSIVERAHVQ